jgi:hypothetical protein
LRNINDTRLAKLAPGHFDDEIHLSIITMNTSPAIQTTVSSTKRLSKYELRKTLPRGWRLWESLEGKYLFEEVVTGNIFWTHPEANFDRDLYISSDIRQKLNFEALSYTWGLI